MGSILFGSHKNLFPFHVDSPCFYISSLMQNFFCKDLIISSCLNVRIDIGSSFSSSFLSGSGSRQTSIHIQTGSSLTGRRRKCILLLRCSHFYLFFCKKFHIFWCFNLRSFQRNTSLFGRKHNISFTFHLSLHDFFLIISTFRFLLCQTYTGT
ncbi:hypothetical protein IX325_001885 [Fusobacterium necrophorum subsp. funduliforme]|nr:hypothetical protein [Fusobacterium necrophorum subsp. funduliforme]